MKTGPILSATMAMKKPLELRGGCPMLSVGLDLHKRYSQLEVIDQAGLRRAGARLPLGGARLLHLVRDKAASVGGDGAGGLADADACRLLADHPASEDRLLAVEFRQGSEYGHWGQSTIMLLLLFRWRGGCGLRFRVVSTM